MNINKITKILKVLGKFNLPKKYKEYKNITKALSEHNTIDITEFMKLNTEDKIMVLFSHVTATHIKQDMQSKLLWIILGILVTSTGGVAYLGVG